MSTKYWKQPAVPSYQVTYDIVGDDEKENEQQGVNGYGGGQTGPGKYEMAACYSAISYPPISERVKAIVVRQPFETIPYAESEIRRWIADLNEVGFPCTVEACDPTLLVRVNLSDYTKKEHLLSTLYLIRVLWETGRNDVVEKYLTAMDADPTADKIIEIQKAHKHGFSAGHTGITGSYMKLDNKTPNLTREQVFENAEKHGRSLHSQGSSTIYMWGASPRKGYE